MNAKLPSHMLQGYTAHQNAVSAIYFTATGASSGIVHFIKKYLTSKIKNNRTTTSPTDWPIFLSAKLKRGHIHQFKGKRVQFRQAWAFDRYFLSLFQFKFHAVIAFWHTNCISLSAAIMPYHLLPSILE